MSDRLHTFILCGLALIGAAILFCAYSLPADALPKPANPVSIVRCNHG